MTVSQITGRKLHICIFIFCFLLDILRMDNAAGASSKDSEEEELENSQESPSKQVWAAKVRFYF